MKETWIVSVIGRRGSPRRYESKLRAAEAAARSVGRGDRVLVARRRIVEDKGELLTFYKLALVAEETL